MHADALSAITLIGCVISIACLVATIVVHAFFRPLRTSVPSQLLLNLCVALLFSYILFILASQARSSDSLCRTWAMGMHFFWLVAMAWMTSTAVNLHGVVAIVLSLKMELRLRLYYACSWGLPAVVVLATALARPGVYGDEALCWINDRSVLIGAFLVPVALCIAANIVLFAIIVSHLHRAAALRRKSSSIGLHQEQASVRRELRAIASVFFLLGLTWIFGAFIDTNKAASLAFQYLFAIFVSLQGVAIFLFQVVFNDRVKEAWERSQMSRATFSSSGPFKTLPSKLKLKTGLQQVVAVAQTPTGDSSYQSSFEPFALSHARPSHVPGVVPVGARGQLASEEVEDPAIKELRLLDDIMLQDLVAWHETLGDARTSHTVGDLGGP